MELRSLGWVQDSTDVKKLKNIVNIFVENSAIHKDLVNNRIPSLGDDVEKEKMLQQLLATPIVIDYALLKGRGARNDETRATAPCTGIAQAVLPSQQGKDYQSDWATNSFLVWAIAIGFLSYNQETDQCSLTKEGQEYATAQSDEEAGLILKNALLTYPPVCRVLKLLSEAPENHLTKFEIGSELGFAGEKGFTCFSQQFILEALSELPPEEHKKFLTNTEGTADKYVRTICSWLQKVGWVKKEAKMIATIIHGKEFNYPLGAYRLTANGRIEMKRAFGMSRYARLPKNVYYSMLSPKALDKSYLRLRRALLLRFINKNYHSLEECSQFLSLKGVNENVSTIFDDISGFERIGLNVAKKGNKYKINDTIQALAIPDDTQAATSSKSQIEELKSRLRPIIKNLDHKYLYIIDLGFGNNNESSSNTADRDYELWVTDLLVTELKFTGTHLGGSRRPDICVYDEEKGLIVDNKAYSKGFSLPMHQADEMVRYLNENIERKKSLNKNEWWKAFDDKVKLFYFAFISGSFSGGFKNRLVSIHDRTGVRGAVISSENLLKLAEQVKAGTLSRCDAIGKFSILDEVKIL